MTSAATRVYYRSVLRRILRDLASWRKGHEIQIVNGRKPVNIAKALAGVHVGTLIHAE